ncbi:MAG: TetR/AcrR family transcriptional regulator [Paracoccaceae bacterium]
METEDKNPIPEAGPPRERLLAAGTELFSAKGYEGASVREICSLAQTSSNMIHHYFGSKKGLYDEILSGFSHSVFSVPLRIISVAPRSREDLISRLEIFVGETLEALIPRRELFEMIARERIVFDVFAGYNERLVEFIEAGKAAGFVRAGIDTEMLTGLILDRVGNQIHFAKWIREYGGTDIGDDSDYRERWLKANLDLVFNGLLAR